MKGYKIKIGAPESPPQRIRDLVRDVKTLPKSSAALALLKLLGSSKVVPLMIKPLNSRIKELQRWHQVIFVHDPFCHMRTWVQITIRPAAVLKSYVISISPCQYSGLYLIHEVECR